MKNPYAGTMASVWAKYLLVNRKWTPEQVQRELERLWDEKGPEYRARYFLRVNNILTMRNIRRKANRSGVDAKGHAIIWWTSPSGKTFSSAILAKSPL